MSNRNNNQSDHEYNFSGIEKRNSFSVPEDYFDLLTFRIISAIDKEEESARHKILSGINKKEVFAIPRNYFEKQTDKLELLWESLNYKTITDLKKSHHPELKSAYFNSLEDKIIERMEKEDELKEFNILSSLPKKNNFETPDHYFDKKTTSGSDNPTSTKKAGVVRSLFTPKRLAIAASLLIVIGSGITWLVYHQSSTETGDCHTLACLEKNEILNEHTVSDFDEDNLYEMVDVDSLGKQLTGSEPEIDSLVNVKSKSENSKETEKAQTTK